MPPRSRYAPVATSESKSADESGFRRQLYIIVFEAETPAGAAFDIILLVTILISVLVVILESVPSLRHHYGPAFRLSEYMFTSAFMLEYILRLTISPSPTAYACSFFGLVDAASILPTFVDLLVRRHA